MAANERRLKEARGNAQRRIDEITRFIIDGPNNLAELLTRATRAGMDSEQAGMVFDALRDAVNDCERQYFHAIQHPEPVIKSHRVVL